MIWLRAVAFILTVQVGAVVLVPTLIGVYAPGRRLPLGDIRYFGAVSVACGAVAILWCNYLFVVRGRGTAAPYDPPREFVAVGAYRFVRNPMYVGATLMTLGQAMLWRSSTLLVYSVLLAVAYHIFVRYFEEPRLTELFGATYAKYCADVPRWWPRSPRAT